MLQAAIDQDLQLSAAGSFGLLGGSAYGRLAPSQYLLKPAPIHRLLISIALLR